MSVAIRAITRLQDADDINVSLGVGVDEYALCWDNDTARFVLRAMPTVVTDHGALTGLTDDDHSQYLLATGARTGASAASQPFTNGIVGPSWKPSANSTTALQLQNATGTSILNVDTTNARVGIGTTAPGNKFEVVDSAFPVLKCIRTSAATNTLLGALGIEHKTSDNMADGFGVGLFFNIQDNASATLAIGSIGAFRDGADTEGGIKFLAGTNGLEEFVTLKSSGFVGIGTTSPASLLHALLTSAATNAVTNVLTIGHDTSGTAAAGFGAGQLFNLESSTTAAQSAARIQALWYEATHATRKADLVGTAYDAGGEREGWRVRGNGSAAAFSVLGAPPIARIAHVADPSGGGTVDAEARSAINSILATLEGFGFHATS